LSPAHSGTPSAAGAKSCHYCKRSESPTLELRPYGPKGSWVCFPCATLPEHEDQTKREYLQQLDAAGVQSPVVVLTADGPKPLKGGGQ
jgi:hypothetical protein